MNTSPLELVTLLCAFGLCAYGAVGLVALWLFPTFANSRFYGVILSGSIQRSRRNKALLMLQALLVGAFLVLLVGGYTLLSALLLAPLCAVTLAAVRAWRRGVSV